MQNTIAKYRALRSVKRATTLRLVPTSPREAAPYAVSAPAGQLPTRFGHAEAARHVERVITPNEYSTPNQLMHLREELRKALLRMGTRWVGHPSRRITRPAKAATQEARA